MFTEVNVHTTHYTLCYVLDNNNTVLLYGCTLTVKFMQVRVIFTIRITVSYSVVDFRKRKKKNNSVYLL